MFSLSLAIVLFITFGINGQTNDTSTLPPNNLEKGYPFGQLRLSEEGKNEELIPASGIEKPQIIPDQSSGVHPLPSPCIGASRLTKLVYPRDKTKYIQCRDEFHYEIFTCPNGGEYNEQTDSCDLIIPLIDKCKEEKPCLNDGQCQLLSNSTFKCICRADWTGDRCETPINSCVKKPCGPNAECRSLKTVDYEQDYVCVCHATRGYGLTCQETVSNPCLTTAEQFFHYAFSQHAYIQCDGELIHFQPCGPVLYWNQEGKICDRKRPTKINFPTLLTKLASNNMENQQEKDEKITSITTTEQKNQNGKENEGIFAFVPARVANRQQLQANINNQQGLFGQNLRGNEQNTQELPNQSIGSNQIRQDVMSRFQQWLNHQTGSTIRQPPTVQSGQNQPWSQNTQQQQGTPMLTEASSMNSNIDQSQIGQDNQQQQQQNFPQQNQAFGSQQWLNQVPDTKTQNNQRFGSQPQSWQGSQTIQNQPQFQNQNQPTTFETTTVAQNINRFQGVQNPNTQMTGNQLPQSVGFNSQNTQNFATQPQSWQTSQTIQNQPGLQNQNQQTFLETTTVPQNIDRFQGFQSPNIQAQDQSWQHRPNTQSTANQSPQSIGINVQNSGPQLQPWQSSRTLQNQPRFQDQNQQSFIETTTAQNVIRLQGFQNSNTQMTGNQLPQSVGFNPQNTQNFVPQQQQQQSWQTSQSFQNQPQLTPNNPEEKSIDNKNRLTTGIKQNNQFNLDQQTIQNQQQWQNKGINQIRQNSIQPETSLIDIQRIPLNNEQLFVGQPLQNPQWSSTLNLESDTDFNKGQLQKGGIQSQIKQDNQQQPNQVFGSQQSLNQVPDTKTQTNQRFGSQPQSWQASQTIQNQPTTFETTTVAQNINRFQGFQNPNTQIQDQSWQTRPSTQQIQTQVTQPPSNPVFAFQSKQWPDTSKNSEIQNPQFGLNQQQKGIPIQNFFDQKQSWLNNQQFQPKGNPLIDSNAFTQNLGNSFETTTISTKGNYQGLPIQGSRAWQSNRPIEQDKNQITPTEQRKTLDSTPTLLSGSWKYRS